MQKKRSKKRSMNGWYAPSKVKGGVVFTLIVLSLAHVALFHNVRGLKIVDPSDDQYERAVARMYSGPMTVCSTEEMQDLGSVAWKTVSQAGLSPGSFYVFFLPQLDTREKLHHFFHSPFTGLDSIYADIWFNSCTVYGLRESTWGIHRSNVYPADKLSVLLILIDRLKREKTSMQEHLGAYIEVFSVRELNSPQRQAQSWVLLMKQCANDDKLADLVERQLEMRQTENIDMAESDLWNYISKQPTKASLEVLAATQASQFPRGCENKISYQVLFKKLLKQYRSVN